LVYLGVDGKLGAVFIFGDHLREKILPTVQELKERGYRLVLVSGDGIQTTPLIVYKIKRKNILKLLQECLEFKH